MPRGIGVLAFSARFFDYSMRARARDFGGKRRAAVAATHNGYRRGARQYFTATEDL